jgi:AmmeMemoRadiSam system protein B
MLGTSHSSYQTSVSYSDWETPIGIIKNDIEFSRALKLHNNEDAHTSEHSIEVQLPFLQYANRDKLKEIKICPIVVNDWEGVAEKVREISKDQQKKITIVASSDFTHYGPMYGYVPFTSNVEENLYKLDRKAIQKILNLDIEGFIQFLDKTEATICGAKPILVLMEYMHLTGMKNSKLLHYTTSGDVLKDFSNAVGYAAAAFY